MGHKCFISYKKEDREYKDKLQNSILQGQIIDKTLDRVINSEDGEYVMRKIREDYLSDSTVTIFLIGSHSSEHEGCDFFGRPHNYFIKKELQASLYNGPGNTRNGILGIVLPEMYDFIYKGEKHCSICGKMHNIVQIDENTTINEFSANYYIKPHEKCAWSEEERYCVLVRWDDFINDPNTYIDQAYNKRSSSIANKVRVRVD